MLLVLSGALALDGLVMHRNADVSLVLRGVRRRMRGRRTVSGHWHGLRGDHGRVLKRVGHGSRIAFHDIWAWIGYVWLLDRMDRRILHWHGNLVVRLLLRVAGMRTPSYSLVLWRLDFTHGRWRINMRRGNVVGVRML